MNSGNCLTHEELRQIIESVCSLEQQSRYEQHIGRCADCQRRLEELCGAMPEHVTRSEVPTSSPSLTTVMEQLRSVDPAAQGDNVTTPADRTGAAFSYLQPPSREHSLGRLANYEILSLLGRGGMGEVFVGFDSLLNREVAIKVPSRSILETPQAHERFVREARAIAAVQHDNIVTVHAAEETDGILLLVMELVHGESLADRLSARQKLPAEEVLAIGQQVAAALEAAHAVGVVHRDITPANLLLDEKTGRVKVSDFGLARPATDGSMTSSSMLVGTPDYMSPEQATEAEVGTASDLFSLGTVLYEACSGRSPFRAKTVLSTLRRVSEENPPVLHDLDRSIPLWFSDVVGQLMSKNPEDRPQSASNVLEVLRNEGRAPTITAVSVTDNTNRSAARRWALAILGLVVIGCAIPPIVHFANSTSLDSGNAPPANTPSTDPYRQEPGFFVVSAGETFADLGEALAAAHDDDSIEVHGNGPFRTEGASLGSKRITIRAADGSSPLFVSAGENSGLSFLQSTSDLSLEGIGIAWMNTIQPANTLPQRASACVISVMNANLKLARCRLVSESRRGCLSCQGGSIELVDSHFQSGSCSNVIWIPAGDTRFSASQCVFESERASLVISRLAPRRSASRANVVLRDNTFSGAAVLQLMIDRPLRPMNVESRRNVFDTATFLRVTATPRTLGPNDSRSFQKQMIFSRLDWTESQNGYRTGIYFIKRGRPEDTRPQLMIEPSFDGWLVLADGRDSGSFETEFQSPDPDSEEQTSDQDPLAHIRTLPPNAPAQAGADLGRVGPSRR